MTEIEARVILENYRETDADTGEQYRHKVIRCVGPSYDGFIFECSSNGYFDITTLTFVECANVSYEVAVYPDGTVLCVPQ